MSAPRLEEQPHVVRRRQRLEGLVDLGSGVGLEIGPLDSPVATRPQCDVRYVDVLDTSTLRARFRDDPIVTEARIVEVDFSLQCSNGMRTLAEAASSDAPYRWIVACHVIEHVPDLVGWLHDVGTLLCDGGQLALVVPDRRFTFDAIRPPTTVGQMLEAHSGQARVPSERAVFDYVRSAVSVSAPELWAGASPADAPRMHPLELAVAMREAALRGEFVDSHVWVFSPAEFVAQLAELGELDLCEFAVERVIPTVRDELEFTVVLRRVPRVATEERRAALRRAAFAALHADGLLEVSTASDADGKGTKTMEVSEIEARLLGVKRDVVRCLRAWRADLVGRGRATREGR